MFTIRGATEREFSQVRSFYHTLIDEMADAPHRPGWQKGVYPADESLLRAIGGGELYLGFWEGDLAAAMVVNHDVNAGYAGVRWLVDADADEVTVIHVLGVRPPFGGNGLGRRMVEEALRMARRTGQKAVRLDVLSGNLPAERLYTGAGFRYITTVSLFYEDTGWAEFLLYEYPLCP